MTPTATEIINGLSERLKAFNQDLTAQFEPAEDESVDDAVAVLRGGNETGLEIQIGHGYLGVGYATGEGEDMLFYDLWDGKDPQMAIAIVTRFIRTGWKVPQ